MVATLALVAGCGGDDDTTQSQPPEPGVFVDHPEGTFASIALVTDGKSLTGGYVCLPKAVTTWLSPEPLEQGQAKLVSRSGENVGEVSFDGDGASGDVTVADGSHSFSATLATEKAGLYRTSSGKPGEVGFRETGWVVLADGSVCGNTTLVSSNDFKVLPAPSSPKGQVTDFANPYGF